MDYQGAIRAFEESLEADPHSAAAHFQLGWLYDAEITNPAAAIYHYEKYLEFKPDAGNAEIVKQRIEACKQKLAEDVFALPSMPAAQREIEQLTAQIEQLKNQNRQLQEQNQQLQAGVSRWSAYCADLQSAQSNAQVVVRQSSFATSASHPDDVQKADPSAAAHSAARNALESQTDGKTAVWRTHMVVAGETAVRIARRYGISLDTLLAANPGLEPRRMPVGLILNVPPSRNSVSPFLAFQK